MFRPCPEPGWYQLLSEDPGRELPFVADVATKPGDIVFAVDLRQRVIYWNKEAEAAFGWSSGHAVGAPLESVCPMSVAGKPVDVAAIADGHDFAGGIDTCTRSGASLSLYLYAAQAKTLKGK